MGEMLPHLWHHPGTKQQCSRAFALVGVSAPMAFSLEIHSCSSTCECILVQILQQALSRAAPEVAQAQGPAEDHRRPGDHAGAGLVVRCDAPAPGLHHLPPAGHRQQLRRSQLDGGWLAQELRHYSLPLSGAVDGRSRLRQAGTFLPLPPWQP